MKTDERQKMVLEYNQMVDVFEGTIQARNIKIAELVAKIDQLRTELQAEREKQKWIRCDERLPGIDDTILNTECRFSIDVMIADEDIILCSCWYNYGNNHWYSSQYDRLNDEPTHWRPMPTLPEVKG